MNPTRNFRSSLLALITGALFLAASASAAVPRDPYKHFFNDTFGDLTEEVENARDSGKKAVFIFFEMDECPFCHRMKSSVLNQPEVQEYFRENFINIAVDIEGDVEMVDFSGESMSQKDFAFKKHRVRATPVMAFFDLEGKRIARVIGAVSGPTEFIWFGEYVVSGAHEKTSWTRYKRERKAAERN